MTQEKKISRKRLLMEKYGGKCFYCGGKLILETMTVDHYVPQNKGGGDEIENLRPSCQLCNQDKSHLDLRWFARKTDLQVEETTNLLKQLKTRSKKLHEMILWEEI